MWQMFLGAGIMGFLGNQGKREMADINNRLSEVNTTASNQVRRARNAETAGRNSLARYTQSVNNQRVLDDGGDAFTANLVNGLKRGDTQVNQGLLMDIRNLEEFGAAAASQAGAGVGGQVVDMINSTTALRASISGELTRQEGVTANFEVGQRAKSIMSQMVGGMDSSLIIDQFDHAQDYSQRTYAPSAGSAIFNSVLNTAVKAGVGNVASWASKGIGDLSKMFSGVGTTESSTGWGATLTSRSSPYSFNPSAAKFGWSLKPDSPRI